MRAIEPALRDDPLARARHLRARAIATDRLGFPEDALGDLHEARRLIEGNAAELAAIFQAIATVFSWRGEGREAALSLLRAVAEATAAGDNVSVGSALIESGRLQLELGRPGEAHVLLARGIEVGAGMPRGAFQRAWVSLAQAFVASGRHQEARAHLAAMPEALRDASPRLALLAQLEAARCAIAESALDAAAGALDRARAHMPEAKDSFERVEVALVEAELAIARRDVRHAVGMIGDVVARCAADDLAAREVQARLLQATAYEGLGNVDEAERTLAAALRRAIARGLSGYADAVRSRLMAATHERGAPAQATFIAGTEAAPERRFVRQRPLGAGAFAKVSRAYDLELGIEVAVKRTTLQGIFDPAARDTLRQAAQREMATAARLAHPGVARAFGLLSVAGGDTLVIEELVEGPTLRAAMAAGIDPARSLALLSRIAFSLAAVHAAGVVHRDLKPENIILRNADTPVLIDFGVAKLAGQLDGRRGIGTPGYMAPEQARGVDPDARADLYALGVIATEMLTGRRPEASGLAAMRGVRVSLVQQGVDGAVAHLVSRLIAPYRWLRPGSPRWLGRRWPRIMPDRRSPRPQPERHPFPDRDQDQHRGRGGRERERRQERHRGDQQGEQRRARPCGRAAPRAR